MISIYWVATNHNFKRKIKIHDTKYANITYIYITYLYPPAYPLPDRAIKHKNVREKKV